MNKQKLTYKLRDEKGGSQNWLGHGLTERAFSISGWVQLGSSNLCSLAVGKRVLKLSNRLYVQGEAHRNYCCPYLTSYWSSTEYNNNNSWMQRFNDGNQNNSAPRGAKTTCGTITGKPPLKYLANRSEDFLRVLRGNSNA